MLPSNQTGNGLKRQMKVKLPYGPNEEITTFKDYVGGKIKCKIEMIDIIRSQSGYCQLG